MSTLTKLIAGALIVVLAACAVLWWQLEHRKNDAAEAAVAPAKEAAAVATAKVESVTVTLAGRIDTVTRRIHDTVTVPEHVLHPVTPADTDSAVAALPTVKAERDSIAKGCTDLVTVAEAHVTACQLQHRADSTLNATLEALVKSRPPRRHWSLGMTGGYGALLSHGQILTGPSISAGVTWSLF